MEAHRIMIRRGSYIFSTIGEVGENYIMRSVIFVLFAKLCSRDHIRGEGMSGVYNTDVKMRNKYQISVRKSQGRGKFWRRSCTVRFRMWYNGGLLWTCNYFSGCIRRGQFLGQLRNFYLYKKSAPWNLHVIQQRAVIWRPFCHCFNLIFLTPWCWVRLWVHLVRRRLLSLLYQPRRVGGYGAFGGMRIGRGENLPNVTLSTTYPDPGSKPATNRLCATVTLWSQVGLYCVLQKGWGRRVLTPVWLPSVWCRVRK
jgi:hypothetical protein